MCPSDDECPGLVPHVGESDTEDDDAGDGDDDGAGKGASEEKSGATDEKKETKKERKKAETETKALEKAGKAAARVSALEAKTERARAQCAKAKAKGKSMSYRQRGAASSSARRGARAETTADWRLGAWRSGCRNDGGHCGAGCTRWNDWRWDNHRRTSGGPFGGQEWRSGTRDSPRAISGCSAPHLHSTVTATPETASARAITLQQYYSEDRPGDAVVAEPARIARNAT